MIQQQHIEPYPSPEVSTGKKITMPGLGVDIRQVMQMYSRGSMEERAKGYYEQEGMEVPDFARMSHIEKLEALGEYRRQAKESNDKLNKLSDASVAKQKDAILQKTVKQKVDDELNRQSSEYKKGGNG